MGKKGFFGSDAHKRRLKMEREERKRRRRATREERIALSAKRYKEIRFASVT